MKTIIIVNNNLKTGGVQISLLNLLKDIASVYDITLLLFYADEQNSDLIPKNIKVMTVKSPFKYFGMSLQESKSSFAALIGKVFWAVVTKTVGRSFAIRLMSIFQHRLKGYDCAISYLHEGPQKSFYGGCNEFVLRKIQADKKIAWIHCDFGLCGANNKQSKKIYKRFDTIVACSNGTKEAFLRCMPELKDKCAVVRNCNDYESIRTKAEPAMQYSSEYFNVITVARLSSEKGIDRMLYAVKHAITLGYPVMYHIVGDGQEREPLEKLVDMLGISDSVIFYGNQKNPYSYIVSADLFVLPSYHEAAPMVFDEAASLGVPVLATKTTSTDEMILKENAGFVCENTQEGITQMLIDILNNPQSLKQISKGLTKRQFTNQMSIAAVKELF